MKAVIILILFIAVLAGGAISHSSRTPSSIASKNQDPLALLTRISPGRQSVEITKKRIAALRTTFEFMRAFPSFYWWNLQSLKSKTHLTPILALQGVILGDVHLENFGTLVNRKGEIIPYVNDFDDITIGPFILDIMRLFLAIELSQKIGDAQSNQYNWWKYYAQGIQGEKFPSAMVEEISKKAAKQATIMDDEIEEKNGVWYFTKRRDDSRDLTSKEILSSQQWTQIISEEYQLTQLELQDSYAREKLTGGSGGLVRFYNLYQSQKAFFVFEIKPLVRPSPDYFTKKTYSAINRSNQLNEYLQKLNMNNLVNISRNRGAKASQLRMKIKGEKQINPLKKQDDQSDSYSYEEKIELIRFQFNLIGQIHGQQMSSKDKNNYLLLIEQHRTELDVVIDQLKNLHINTFQQLKNI